MSRKRSSLALAAALLVGAAAGCAGVSGAAQPHSAASPARTLRVLAGGRTLLAVPVPAGRLPAARRAQVGARAAARLPALVEEQRGRARLTLRVLRSPAAGAVVHALALGQRDVVVPLAPVSSSIALAPVQQVLHNDCEAASLSMLLAAAGVHVGQLALQQELPQSGPLDPQPVPGSSLLRWGDPEQGFVGRVDGSGPEGGFGVYEPPIRALAARHGVRLVDLEGTSVAAVRASVLAGRPVLAWVGLEAGPYESWLTPAGRVVTANLNEHAVVVVGAGPGYVLVNDPLSGKRTRWPEWLFSARWLWLGRRALALPAP